MLLDGKKVLIMGIRNKWSIAWGAARSAYENGAKVIFTHHPMENIEKIEELISEIPEAKTYPCDAADDASIEECLKKVYEENGKIDGILHSIAHANTSDLRNDFILTSREGYAHACDISSYSLVAVSRIARDNGYLNEGASIVAFTYYGSEKVMEGYNIMGVAKAALETGIKYLSKDLGKDGYRINGVSAGPIKTLSAKGIKDFNSILDVVEKRAPLKANVTTTQVGDVTTFLFSKLSSCVTGEIIHADNGFNVTGI